MRIAFFVGALASFVIASCTIDDAIEDALEYQHAYSCTTEITWHCETDIVTTKRETFCAYERETARAWAEHVCRVNVEANGTELCPTATCVTTCTKQSEFCYE